MVLDIRPFDIRDKYRLRHFRCAKKKDAPYAKRVNFILKKHLVPTLRDRAFDARAFVATERNEMLGVVAIAPTSTGYWEVLAVGVSIHARRRGIARQLLQKAVAETPECWRGPILLRIHKDNRKMQSLAAEFGASVIAAPDREGYVATLADPQIILRSLTLARETQVPERSSNSQGVDSPLL